MKPLDAVSYNELGPVFSSASVHGAPLLAGEAALTAYCSVVVFTAVIWAWALSMSEEVEIVKRKGVSMPNIAYYVTRFATLGGCICSVLLDLGLQTYTGHIKTSSLVLFWITQSSTGLLFFFRIRAVYRHSKSVIYGFFFMWMLVATSPLLMFLHPDVRCYRPHRHCYIWGPLTLPGNGAVLLNDTLVFIGVSLHAYRSMSLDTSSLSHACRFKRLVQGHGLYKVSRMLLKSGQLYYGAIIGVQIWTIVTVSLGLRYSEIAFRAYIPFASALACKVFRMVMLCDTTEDPLNTLEIHEMIEVGIMGFA
ncbi:hypothetical protein FIBSPDRAFT_1044500 [Athelia psychrophila]|uniref:DUF6533 domain-containing protein n=1 Tax=Athelia psychrophila TaxID=1759441 RepID=A0A166JJJ6_9AGAM|nr:hypothetical protein FIBSPDRAFT_1044500 [Fibularhizoctonia sp. CBS 109695]